MKYIFSLLFVTLIFAGCTHSSHESNGDAAKVVDEHATHTEGTGATMKDFKKVLADSPRHQEWVEIDNNGKKVHAFVVYPQQNIKTKVVVILHENKGLTDWVRAFADEVAAAGHIAIAPDLLSGYSSEYKKTSDFPNEDAAREAIGQLKKDAVASDIQAVIAYSKGIPASNGNIVSAGFCWGGSQSFITATKSKDLSAAFVFYGSAPVSKEDLAAIDVPVYAYYGGNDERINATVPATIATMNELGKTFQHTTFDGAGHAFMRLGEELNPEPANRTARDIALQRMFEILNKN